MVCNECNNHLTCPHEYQRALHEACHHVVSKALGFKPQSRVFPTNEAGDAGSCEWQGSRKPTPHEEITISLAPYLMSFLYDEQGDADACSSDLSMCGDVLKDFTKEERLEMIREALFRASLILKHRRSEVLRVTDQLLKTQVAIA